MPKWGWGALVNLALAVGLAYTSPPERWKPFVMSAAWIGFVVCCVGWLHAFFRESKPQRGDLHLTVLNLDYEDKAGELIADLMFFNNDSIQRTVLGVTFLYRKSASQQGYDFIATGPISAPFIGHINPVNIAAGGSETRHYSAPVDPGRIKAAGAQFGFLITFTIPERGDESATVMPALEVVKTGTLSIPSLQMPHIKNLSLDSIRDSKQLDAIIERVARQKPPARPMFRKICDRLLDY